ncbi:chromosome segregation protein SMC [Paenibacillus tarimensis]|uniref:chromosome segregation protein SMC n=1 Tax=Paenibacillus tarimensis TaxID=416012 RepID=UPI001F26D8D4|nr:chromosome segregation protein SMC [Paenibacillus tarimensis]MCF2942274.1 chromosome segregation protein SMC [Paenibacillus tarimensis]
MFLKRVELAGFKSFADRTELEFVRGITAVVGPNGSGKSNISDSIRWVLGEQSAKSLRGGNMQDIIFAGSDARKAVNYGEVSLTLDNTSGSLPLEYDEVTVTRRVHRSGESEYLINKQACRLKDITELFMDTGIGKEAYSIIGQGRIEEILSTRSEDRRGIFEEASGIVKYKSRKREAQRKLDDTEQNLLRINDLVTELEDQVEPLRLQSEKAIHYKALREQLRTKEISMYVHQIEQVHSSWKEATARLEKLQNEQLELSAVVSKHDAHLEKDRLQLRDIEEALERLHEDMLRYSEEYEKCEGQGEVLKERTRNLEQNRRQLEESIAAQSERITALTKEETDFRAKAAGLEQELQTLRQRLEEEESTLIGVAGGMGSDAEEKLKGELLDVLSSMASTRNEIRYADQQKETLQKRIERLGEEEAKWQEQLGALEGKREELQNRLDRTVAELSVLRDRYIQEGDRLKSSQQLLEEAQMAVRKWEQKLDALTSRRDTMKEMQNDLDGFMHGVREVLKASRRSGGGIDGVHGAVAELIRVPEKLETAVETALGGALQHVVMEDERSARAAIAFLKQRQLGRATFLPLDVIKGRSVPEQERRLVASVEGFVGVAADLVGSEPAYSSIVANLLGNVLIAETLEQANRIAAKCQYRFRVVTLDGDVVNAGGSMTGGSLQKKGANLLGRQRQIEQLDEDIKQSGLQLDKLRDKVSDLRKELSILGQTIEELRDQGDKRRLEEQQLRSELQQVEQETRYLREQHQMSHEDRSSQMSESTSLDKLKAAAEERLAQLTAQEARLQQSIKAAEDRRKASESAKEELQTHLTDLKIQVAKTDQEKLSFEDQAVRIRSDINRAKQELATLRSLAVQQEEEQRKLEAEKIRQTEELNHYRLKKQECAEQTDFKRAERAGKLRQLEDGESETKEQRAQLRQVEDGIRQTEIAANRLDVELDNVLRKLSEEYELSFELAKERYPVPEDVQGTQNQVRDLKRQITMLGDVNLGAIEEYERVRERYEFLDAQKNDLIEAKTTLYQVIREMDEEMGKRFRTTFDAIRSHFGYAFTKLFGGGRADLVMVDPDRVLETGIDIVAQPPGKKLQNLQLLSGGERALTAMALLFAILQVKPVPFCVLDEVEAALDEANVARFAQYLREFSEQTQFIVVTHRKGTMEEADVLYGVTMEEGGVSKLVSVRLEDDEAAVSA